MKRIKNQRKLVKGNKRERKIALSLFLIMMRNKLIKTRDKICLMTEKQKNHSLIMSLPNKFIVYNFILNVVILN